jgi:CDP-diacylglycerol--inositol 3-phosphatidyltransferase
LTPNLPGIGTILQHLAQPDKLKFAWAHPKITEFILSFMRSVTWPQIIAAITAPVCFAKQVINVVQFWKASKIVGDGNLFERLQLGFENFD